MDALNKEQITAALAKLNAQAHAPWSIDDGALCKNFRFGGFDRAFAFMTALALYAERVNHHPDWRNCYRQVALRLSTFDVHGLTAQDFDFAHQAEKVYLIERDSNA